MFGALFCLGKTYYFSLEPEHGRDATARYCQGSLREELGHLTAGLSKLEEASSTVDDLSKNAEKKKKELQTAQV